jgi:hypothetical protein
MPPIRQLIARRTDLSTFVVHLTRDGERTARENLESILQAGRIEARSPFGSAVPALTDAGADPRDLESQQAVCFTETPLEHLHLLLADIDDLARNCVFDPFGIAVTKRLARETGINPVWYTDITPGHPWLMNSVNALIDESVATLVEERRGGNAATTFRQYPIARLAPFIEQMGTGQTYRKEFWWEREWRHVGAYMLPPRFIVIAPEDDHPRMQAALGEGFLRASYIDADWGLEEIIGRLAGFTALQIALF